MEKKIVLIEMRNKKGLTQQQIADALGISQSAVAMWETGKTVPSINNIVSLSKLLGVSSAKLFKVFSRG